VLPVKWSIASLRIVLPALECETNAMLRIFSVEYSFMKKALLYAKMISIK